MPSPKVNCWHERKAAHHQRQLARTPTAGSGSARSAPKRRPGREVLFNWLQGDLRGARCLDLFAGTGALGLEAASRGAATVVLVEQDHGLCRQLIEVGRQWPGGDVLTVVHADAMRWLERAEGPFDIVFVDPPFGAGLYAATLEALARPGLLAAGALVYVESAALAGPVPAAAGATAAGVQPLRRRGDGPVPGKLVDSPRKAAGRCANAAAAGARLKPRWKSRSKSYSRRDAKPRRRALQNQIQT